MKTWITMKPCYDDAQLTPLSAKVSFVRIDLADWKLTDNNQSITNWVFSVSSQLYTSVRIKTIFVSINVCQKLSTRWSFFVNLLKMLQESWLIGDLWGLNSMISLLRSIALRLYLEKKFFIKLPSRIYVSTARKF